MKLLHFLLILTSLCILNSCQSDETSPVKGSIEGHVINSKTNESLAGCIVTIGETKSETTDDDGYFKLVDITPGNIEIKYSKDGYSPSAQIINITAGQTTIANMAMDPLSAYVPCKAVFFGNSLLTGFGFGMAASAPDKDYYSLVTEHIKNNNPDFESNKYAAHTFEGILSESEIDAEINSIFLDKLTGDEDLVIIQLGDNVHSNARLRIFSESCPKLCGAIREKCPEARVAWVGLWYYRSQQYNVIRNACETTGCQFISIKGTYTPENMAQVGQVVDIGVSGPRTCENVISVVPSEGDFPKEITVTLLVDDKEYCCALLVNSYDVNDGVMQYSSRFRIIDTAGVASHPNDNGFRQIADIIISELGL